MRPTMIEINLDPVLLRLGPLMITWHGFFTAVGVLAGIWFVTRFAVERGYTEDDIMSIALWAVIGGIVGARLFHVVDAWDYYSADPLAILRVNEGGLDLGHDRLRADRRGALRLQEWPLDPA